jgi:two-component system, NarL family, sensor kinase
MSHTDAMTGPSRDAAPAQTAAGVGAPAWRTVTAGGGRDRQERPVRTGRIVAQVVAAAVAVLVVVGVLGAIASRNVAERESVNDAANTTDLLASAVVQPALDDALLTGDPAAIARLDAVIREHVLGSSVVRVKLWTPEGVVVYSDEPQAIGEQFALGEEQQAVFTDPQTRAEVSDLSRAENRFESGAERLLEVYRPVWTPAGQPLLFETYARYDAVTARTSELWRGFAGITLTSLLLLMVLLLPVMWRLMDRLRRAQSQREQLLQRAVDASAEERRRIAAGLHDGVVQDLAASSFAVAGAAEQAASLGDPALADQLRGVLATVRGSIGGLRSLLVDIYPPSLRASGLAAALADAAATLRSRGVDVAVDVPDEAGLGLDPEGEELVFRVAQECLRNVARHAVASRVRLSVRRTAAGAVLLVEDDGVGFDADAVLSEPPEGHFGLRILTDLAERAGATLEVSAAPGSGTRWRLTVPVAAGGRS